MNDTGKDRAYRETQARRVPCYQIMRAVLLDDLTVAYHLIREADDNDRMDTLILGMASVAVNTLLAADGYDVDKVLRTLSFWQATAASGVQSAQAASDARPRA